jgi:type VII secretion protein EccB
MPSRKDLLQAHRLMTQRAALALIAGDPDAPDQPLRRRATMTVCGLLAGVIAAAAFGVLGLLSPGTVTGLTKPGTLAIDKDTGTPYVPCQGQELCPALNYASALLALDTASVNQVDVTQATLSHYRIGPVIGIAGLPQDLPTAGDLVRGPWSVCAAGDVSTLVGGVSVGGTPLSPGSAVLVTAASAGDWVLWHGERLAIDPGVMLTLFGAGAAVTTVPVAWLDAIPQGPDFAAPAIPGQGGTVNGPSGPARVGQVYVSPGIAGTPTQYYVLSADGKLSTVTAVQGALLDREPGAGRPVQISPAAATGDLSGSAVPGGGLPAAIPALAPAASPVCVVYGPGMSRSVTAGGSVPAGAVPVASGGGSGASGGPAGSGVAVSQVWLPPDHGALVGVAPDASSSSGVASWFLVTRAARYGLSASGQPASALAAALGYSLAADQTVPPASVVDLLPQGPVLSPAAATQPAPG